MQTSSRALAALTLGMLVLLGSAAAADPTAAEEQQAAAYYKQGTFHYNLGEYAAAIASYKEGYRIVQNPEFLYNIAQAARLSGDKRQAVTFYRSYLNARPEAKNRAEIQARIAELEDALRKEDESKRALPTAVKPPEPSVVQTNPTAPLTRETDPPRDTTSAPVYKKWWFWTGVGVVAAGAITIAVVSSGGNGPTTDLGNFPVF